MNKISPPRIRRRTWQKPDGASGQAWQLDCSVTIDGKLERVRLSRPTHEKAKEAYGDLVRDVLAGSFRRSSEPRASAPVSTIGEFVELFHTDGSAGKRPKSLQSDRAATARFLVHVGRERRLDEITPRDIDSFVARRLKTPSKRPRRGKLTSEATVSRELATIKKMFNVARRWGLLAVSPAEGTKKPTIPEGDVVFLEHHEQVALLRACTAIAEAGKHNSTSDAPYLRPLAATALYTGLRRAELLNLRWEHVDLERRRLIVQNTLHFRTKTKKNRVLDLTPAAVEELAAWRQWFRDEIGRASERAADGSLHVQLRRKAEVRLAILRRCEPRPSRLVFPSFRRVDEAGEAAPLDNVQSSFSRAVREAGLTRPVGLHSLRHSFAVTLARANVPLTKISRALGHSSLKTTELYLRFAPDESRDVTAAIPPIDARATVTNLSHGSTTPAERRLANLL